MVVILAVVLVWALMPMLVLFWLVISGGSPLMAAYLVVAIPAELVISIFALWRMRRLYARISQSDTVCDRRGLSD